jgi:hypothetical protein
VCAHEGYFQSVGNLGGNGTLRKEAKEFPSDFGWERCYKDAECGHLSREEHKGERVAAYQDCEPQAMCNRKMLTR